MVLRGRNGGAPNYGGGGGGGVGPVEEQPNEGGGGSESVEEWPHERRGANAGPVEECPDERGGSGGGAPTPLKKNCMTEDGGGDMDFDVDLDLGRRGGENEGGSFCFRSSCMSPTGFFDKSMFSSFCTIISSNLFTKLRSSW